MEAGTDAESWDRFNARLCGFIALAREGDVHAFEQLYLGTASWLLSRVRRLVGDGQAEDVLAEVYLQAWRSLDSFDASRGSGSAWLSMIARSRALDHLRHEKCRPTDGDGELESEPASSEGPEQLLSRAQDARLVQVSMSLLNCDERLVLGLAYFQDCTHNEISSSTGLPLGTVKSLMSRAQKKLRGHFAAATAPRLPVLQQPSL